MSNNVTQFMNNTFGVITVIDIEGQPWFIGKEIVEKLGYDLSTGTSYTKYISRFVLEEDVINYVKETQVQFGLEFDYKNLGQRGGLLINEFAIYDLVSKSPLPAARQFQIWITHEVLPMIARHGVYIPGNTPEEIVNNGLLGINTVIKSDINRDLLADCIKKNDELLELKREGKEEAFDRYYSNHGNFDLYNLYDELQPVFNLDWEGFKNIDWIEYFINHGYISYNKYTNSYLQDNERIISIKPVILTFKGFKEIVFNIKYNGKLKRYIK